jgi:Pyridoxamine 5'-phosphate oxidase
MLQHQSAQQCVVNAVHVQVAESRWSLLDHAAIARYLIHEADYGVTATQSTLVPGWPFGNVLSVSDGPKNDSTGRILFYVADQSVFVADVRQDNRATFTVSQEQTEKGCWIEDPEWPMCARVCARAGVSTKMLGCLQPI